MTELGFLYLQDAPLEAEQKHLTELHSDPEVLDIEFNHKLFNYKLIPVAAHSKACVYSSSLAEIARLNPAKGMNGCLL
jgi:hypothetical protein